VFSITIPNGPLFLCIVRSPNVNLGLKDRSFFGLMYLIVLVALLRRLYT
jgi:hypothetical protein